MSTINTNVQSMIAQRVLGQNTGDMNTALERLSTGVRINSGKDDPAGLIASENLRSEEKSLEAAISNAERADQVINIAEGGLKEVNSQLLELQSLVTESANESGLSQEEKEANQQEIDAILDSIDRIASTTTFQGQKLLNGNFEFNVTNDSRPESVEVTEANGEVELDATVTGSAQKGALFLSLGGPLDFNDNGGEFVLEVTGGEGSKQFSFASGTTPQEMADAINSFSGELGVTASQEDYGGGNGLRLESEEYGDEERVAVSVQDDAGGDLQNSGGIVKFQDTDNNSLQGSQASDFSPGGTTEDYGENVEATVNGQSVGSYGRTLDINLSNVEAEVLLSEDSGDDLNAVGGDISNTRDLFTVDGDSAATFSIGPDVGPTSRINNSIKSVATHKLGEVDGSAIDELRTGEDANVVDGDLTQAQALVDEAIKEVSELRGRLGSIQKNTLEPTINNLNVTKENTAAAESSIRDTDFAKTTAEMTRAQILQQSATNTLSMANNQPQNVLSLLGGAG